MRTDRIQKILDFFIKLEDDKFQYTEFVERYEEKEANICGTVCCLYGWMPSIDKEHFKWKKFFSSDVMVVYGENALSDERFSFAEYLEITGDEAANLVFHASHNFTDHNGMFLRMHMVKRHHIITLLQWILTNNRFPVYGEVIS